jgi:hypothetical protein
MMMVKATFAKYSPLPTTSPFSVGFSYSDIVCNALHRENTRLYDVGKILRIMQCNLAYTNEQVNMMDILVFNLIIFNLHLFTMFSNNYMIFSLQLLANLFKCSDPIG